MGGENNQAGQAGGPEYAEIQTLPIHLSTPSNLSMVES